MSIPPWWPDERSKSFSIAGGANMLPDRTRMRSPGSEVTASRRHPAVPAVSSSTTGTTSSRARPANGPDGLGIVFRTANRYTGHARLRQVIQHTRQGRLVGNGPQGRG